MTNAIRLFDQAARRAGALPLARIAAAVLGGSAAFFALAMPPRILEWLLAGLGLPFSVGLAGQMLFALLFALLAASAGWLALTLAATASSTPPPVVRAPAPPRNRAVAPRAEPESAPTLRRGDAHPDAPPRRPIFAAHDLGTPFDEIVTDRKIVRAAPEAAFDAPDAPVDLDQSVTGTPPAPVTEAAEELPVAEAAPPASVPPGEEPRHHVSPATDEPADRPVAAAEVAVPKASGPAAPADEVVIEPPQVEAVPLAAEVIAPVEEVQEPCGEAAPATPRANDSIAALMARFEGGLGRLDGYRLPPPDLESLSTLKRAARNPDDALRDALEALQQMAARQR